MTDQGVSKEVPQQQFFNVNSLKDVVDPAKKYLRKKKRQLKLRAKVNNVQNNAGQLVDSTGFINFILDGVTVNAGQTYELVGTLRVVDYKFTINVTSVAPSAEPITATGNEQFSAAQIDANSGKPITTIAALLTSRIGQSFFAKPLNVVVEQKKAKATLADQTGTIDVEISTVNKQITQEVLNNLSSGKVYLFSDMVVNFTTENKLVGRFNYRSSIIESNDHSINEISNINLSAKVYTEEEKKDLSDVLQIKEKKPKAPKSNNNNNKSNKRNNNSHKNNNNGEKKVQKRNIAPSEPVTIAQLEQWNNNQTFYGKILTLNVESKTLKAKEGEQPAVRTYLKGTVGDETGVIEFDMAEKKDVPTFKVGDHVKFIMAMNKGRNTVNGEAKVGGHYVEVKRYGSYEVYQPNGKGITINTENNLSAKELTARPKTENNRRSNNRRNNNNDNKGHNQNNRSSSPNQQHNNKPRKNNNHNDDGVRQNSNNRNRNQNKDQNNDNRRSNSNNQRYNNNNNNNNNRGNNNNRNNNRSHSNNNNNRNNNRNNSRNNNNNNNNNYNNNNRNNNRDGSAPPRPQKRILTDIINLRPGERNIDFVGYVYDIQEFQKEINDKTLFFLRGRVADATANIKFDIKKPRNIDIQEGNTYFFSNVINKVNNEGFHFVDIFRFGKITLAKEAIKNPNTSNANDSDRSAIEYIKKTMEN